MWSLYGSACAMPIKVVSYCCLIEWSGEGKAEPKSASSSAEQRAVKNHFNPVCHPRSTKSQTSERKEIVNFDLKGERKRVFNLHKRSEIAWKSWKEKIFSSAKLINYKINRDKSVWFISARRRVFNALRNVSPKGCSPVTHGFLWLTPSVSLLWRSQLIADLFADRKRSPEKGGGMFDTAVLRLGIIPLSTPQSEHINSFRFIKDRLLWVNQQFSFKTNFTTCAIRKGSQDGTLSNPLVWVSFPVIHIVLLLFREVEKN